MFENFKSDQLSAKQSESVTGGRGRHARGGRKGSGKKTFATAEEKAAFMEKKAAFKDALSELREGDAWSGLTSLEKKTQKQTLRQSIFG